MRSRHLNNLSPQDVCRYKNKLILVKNTFKTPVYIWFICYLYYTLNNTNFLFYFCKIIFPRTSHWTFLCILFMYFEGFFCFPHCIGHIRTGS